MRISPVSINKINFIRNNQYNLKGLQSKSNIDSFTRTTTFGFSSDKSFDAFNKWARETNFVENVQDIIDRTGTILGAGFEGTTYSIPGNEQWVIKQFNRSKVIPETLKKPEISRIKDISPDLNIGQFVATVKVPMNDRLAHHLYILKKQTGQSYGVPHTSRNEVNDSTVKLHLDSLNKLARMPMDTYRKLVDDISYVTQRGYKFDAGNPYNFMIDSAEKRVNFVDIADKLDDKSTTQYGDVLYALLDADFAENFKNSTRSDIEKRDAKIYSFLICSKFTAAMQEKKVKFSPSQNFTKVFTSDAFDYLLASTHEINKIKRLKELGLY